MKKSTKIALLSIGSFVGVVVILLAITFGILFNPKRLTPLLRQQLAKNINCQSYLGEVELTFFSTFPKFGVRANNFLLKNRVESIKSDTLLNVASLTAVFNPVTFITKKELIIDEFRLDGGFINLYTDSVGNSNFDVLKKDNTEDKEDSKKSLDMMRLNGVVISNLKLNFEDRQKDIYFHIDNTNIRLNADIRDYNGEIDFTVSADDIYLSINDSTSLTTNAQSLKVNIVGNKHSSRLISTIYIATDSLNLTKEGVVMIDKQNMAINIPLTVSIDSLLLRLEDKGYLEFANQRLSFSGSIQKKLLGFKNIDFNLQAESIDIEKLLDLIPNEYKQSLNGKKIGGKANLSCQIKGDYYDSIMPMASVRLMLQDINYSQADLPIEINHINGEIASLVDMSHPEKSNMHLRHIGFSVGQSSGTIDGSVSDLLGSQSCDMSFDGNINIADFKAFVPSTMKIDGITNTSAHAIFSVDNAMAGDIQKIKVNATNRITNLDAKYEDSIRMRVAEATIKIAIPSKHKNSKFDEAMSIDISQMPDVYLEKLNSTNVNLQNANLQLGLSNVLDSGTPLQLFIDYNLSSLLCSMDTISAEIKKPNGVLYMLPSAQNKDLYSYTIDITSPRLSALYGKTTNLHTKDLSLGINITYDSSQKEPLLQFLPNIDADINDISVQTADLGNSFSIPYIDFILTPEKLLIDKSRFVLKKSDFNLSGSITNISEYLKNKGLLTANLKFTSDMVDVYELMDIVDGFGSNDSTNKDTTSQDKNPFMVPHNVDITLLSKVSHGKVAETDIYNLGGNLIVKDGVMILEQIGFTCEAAKMQLTAIYRPERRNHLFAGVDFHLIDINIDKLIGMLPQVDTIIPMLKYFKGKGEFHFAAESYLNANYDIKHSTLRGASAIEGKDLVLLDSKTFDEIAKKLLFKKKTQNIVDSLSVEMTIFRDEVELFPFLLSMDNYQVVLQGIYNLSDSYKIKAETISPIRLGVDLTSTKNGEMKLENLKLFNLQYSNLFKPNKRNAVQQEIMAIKKMISDALKANVKPQ